MACSLNREIEGLVGRQWMRLRNELLTRWPRATDEELDRRTLEALGVAVDIYLGLRGSATEVELHSGEEVHAIILGRAR